MPCTQVGRRISVREQSRTRGKDELVGPYQWAFKPQAEITRTKRFAPSSVIWSLCLPVT